MEKKYTCSLCDIPRRETQLTKEGDHTYVCIDQARCKRWRDFFEEMEGFKGVDITNKER